VALSDPQSVTIGSTPGAVSLPRVNTGSNVGTFANYDSKVALKVQTNYGKRTRREARVDFSKVVTDPLVASTNVLVSGTVRLNIDVPPTGFSAAEQKDLAVSLLTWLTASSNANLIKVIAGEN
jgi:hypothetical protein